MLLDGSVTGPAFVSALSDRDLFVETDRPLPVRTRVRMQLFVPGRARVDLVGTVRRLGEGTYTQGMNIEFTPSAQALEAIEEHLYRPLGLRRAPPGYAPQMPIETAAVPPVSDKAAGLSDLVSKYLDEVAPEPGAGEPVFREFEPNDSGVSVLATKPLLSLPAAELEDAAREAAEDWPALPASSLQPEPEAPAIADTPESRFEPEALRLFTSMSNRKIEFLESLDAGTVRAFLDGDVTSITAAPGKIPADFEVCDPELFDPGPDPLLPAANEPETAKTGADAEGERLRAKYNFDDSLFDVDALKQKYAISEDLFGNDDEAPATAAEPSRVTPPIVTVAPPWEAVRREAAAAAVPAPATPEVLVSIGDSKEQRHACALELKKRGQDAFRRGMIVKAAADLGLALAFDPTDADLRTLHEEVREMANAVRAEELYNQGLQEKALGNPAAAASSLLTAARMHPDRKYSVAAVKCLLTIGTPESVKDARVLLGAEQEKEPENVELLLLQARAAEIVSYAKGARIYYRTILKLDPENKHAKDGLARVEKA